MTATQLSCMLQSRGSPLVQALARSLCGNECAIVNLGWYTQQQFAGSRLLMGNPLLLAVSQIIVERELKLGPPFGNRFTMETDDAANAKNTASKNRVSRFVFPAPGSAPVILA